MEQPLGHTFGATLLHTHFACYCLDFRALNSGCDFFPVCFTFSQFTRLWARFLPPASIRMNYILDNRLWINIAFFVVLLLLGFGEAAGEGRINQWPQHPSHNLFNHGLKIYFSHFIWYFIINLYCTFKTGWAKLQRKKYPLYLHVYGVQTRITLFLTSPSIKQKSYMITNAHKT